MPDRAIIEQHLAMAEGHVAKAGELVERQRSLVADLERDGHDTTEARRLLAEFQEIEAMHISDRDRLRRELASL